MIKKYVNGKLEEQTSLISAMGLSKIKAPVISVIGAGGKTTTIKRLTEEYIDNGIPVIVTTTTHVMIEDEPWFLLEPSREKALNILKKEGKVWIGEASPKNGKMQAPCGKFLKEMAELGYPLLVESDGARRLPLKVPGEFEPVYLPETTHVINLYGLDCIGKELKNICFRAETAAKLLGKDINEAVNEKDVVRLMLDRRAGMKNIGKNVKYQVALNKADMAAAEKCALSICLTAHKCGFRDIIVTGQNHK